MYHQPSFLLLGLEHGFSLGGWVAFVSGAWAGRANSKLIVAELPSHEIIICKLFN